MQTSDREQFEEQIMKLCAGFNVPATQHRREAYWTGLQRMSIAQVARSVDLALDENGPDDLPTPKQLWKIHKSKRTFVPPAAPRIEEKDHLLYFANRLFLRHLINRGGVGSSGRFVPGYGIIDCVASPELLAARRAVRETVEWFTGPVLEGDLDATPRAFIESLAISLARVSPIDPRTLEGWKKVASHADAGLPFPEFMARDLAPQQASIAA